MFAPTGLLAMEMADRMTEAPTREYRAVIWTKEAALAGQRVTVLAHSLEEAKKRLEEVHGSGTVFDLHNTEDAGKPR